MIEVKKMEHVRQNERQDIWQCTECGEYITFPRSMGYDGGCTDSQYPYGHECACVTLRHGMLANFELNGEVDICEAAHASILSAMYRDVEVPAAASEWEAWMDVQVALIGTVFEPYQGEYRIVRCGGHISIDRASDFPVKALAGKRFGVLGLR